MFTSEDFINPSVTDNNEPRFSISEQVLTEEIDGLRSQIDVIDYLVSISAIQSETIETLRSNISMYEEIVSVLKERIGEGE